MQLVCPDLQWSKTVSWLRNWCVLIYNEAKLCPDYATGVSWFTMKQNCVLIMQLVCPDFRVSTILKVSTYI